MKAIILAGGQAKRLRPLTNNLPKCLLKVKGKTVLEYQVEALLTNNINELIIVSGPFTDLLKKFIENKFPDIQVTYINNNNFKKTGPAYGLWLARKFLTEDIMYLNSDVLIDKKILSKVINSNYQSVTAIQLNAWDEEEVNVILDKDRIIKIGKTISKKLNCGEFIGVTKLGSNFNKKLILALQNFIDYKEFNKFAADAINQAIQRGGQMYAVDVSNFKAMEIDTHEDYKNVKKIWNARAEL